MIEIVVANRDKNGDLKAGASSAVFNSASAAYQWYNRQLGHNVEQEVTQAEKGIPIIRWREKKRD